MIQKILDCILHGLGKFTLAILFSQKQVPCSTTEEMNAAVASASAAFKTWSQTSVMSRQAIMFKYQELIKKHLKDIAGLITIEQGKTLPDAEGDVIRGLQVVEHCCSMTNLLLGETLPGLILDFLVDVCLEGHKI